MNNESSFDAPSVEEIRDTAEILADEIYRTPVIRCSALEACLDNGSEISAKLEVLQRTGTFKARAALTVLKGLSEVQRRAGVTAVSAGNHAIATAFAARAVGTSAKVVMIESASTVRMQACREYGAELVLVEDVHKAFSVAEEIQRREGRILVHPFEGRNIVKGTGTLGLEMCEQCPDFEVLLVPVGGGGLIAGVANAVKQVRPDVRIIGIEPFGADSMYRSFKLGAPASIDTVQTIADSLGAPFALPYTFSLCKTHVDDLVRVDDAQLRAAMGLLFSKMKLAVEPACAATTAALFGSLREELAGKKVLLLFCGSNIDWATFEAQAIFGETDVAT
jgi:threonine dehydratase